MIRQLLIILQKQSLNVFESTNDLLAVVSKIKAAAKILSRCECLTCEKYFSSKKSLTRHNTSNSHKRMSFWKLTSTYAMTKLRQKFVKKFNDRILSQDFLTLDRHISQNQKK